MPFIFVSHLSACFYPSIPHLSVPIYPAIYPLVIYHCSISIHHQCICTCLYPSIHLELWEVTYHKELTCRHEAETSCRGWAQNGLYTALKTGCTSAEQQGTVVLQDQAESSSSSLSFCFGSLMNEWCVSTGRATFPHTFTNGSTSNTCTGHQGSPLTSCLCISGTSQDDAYTSPLWVPEDQNHFF